jgi:hypothetical protein
MGAVTQNRTNPISVVSNKITIQVEEKKLENVSEKFTSFSLGPEQ